MKPKTRRKTASRLSIANQLRVPYTSFCRWYKVAMTDPCFRRKMGPTRPQSFTNRQAKLILEEYGQE